MQDDILDNNDSDESEVDVLGELQTVWINHKILSCILFTLFVAKSWVYPSWQILLLEHYSQHQSTTTLRN